jgi:hypothetical protein
MEHEDPLAPARGCINGILIGAAVWVAIGIIVWVVTRG